MRDRIPTRPPDHLDVPASLAQLVPLAFDSWWTWHREARRLFERIDADNWVRYRNPIRQLQLSRSSHLEALSRDRDFSEHMAAVLADYAADLAQPAACEGGVAYVSAEYALQESLPIYSGGLGVLSADHLKEASDMRLPMLGIGLFYRRGYFRQLVDTDGFQQHDYPELDALRLPLLRVAGQDGESLRVPVDLADRTVHLRVWVTYVGRVPLLLLDSFTNRNPLEDRYLTSLLYVRGREARLEQELVLGRGAVAVLDALGIEPGVIHMNEGHSAFLAMENLRRSGADSLEAAIERCRPRHVFTTHTPVPAGNEEFEREQVRPHLMATAAELSTTTDALLDLGRSPTKESSFNLTALALSLSHRTNGVSQLHASVSRQMWPGHEIDGITNGVHVPTWLGREVSKVLASRGIEDPALLAARAAVLSDEALWAAHTAQKHRLMRFVRLRATRQAARHGKSSASLRRIQEMLNPSALTIGFARRFAPYKRADLLFHDPQALRDLLADTRRPVQLILAGKAHPADRAGQAIIREIWKLASTPELRGRIIFMENYDLSVARLMVRGCDVWLNTPEWPHEASGTSGMKAVMNGCLHASVPDGWWAEAAAPEVGFTLGEQVAPDLPRDHRLLMEMVRDRIVPLYFDRGEDGLPRQWIRLMRTSMSSFLERFSTRRMLGEYVRRLYDLPVDAPQATAS